MPIFSLNFIDKGSVAVTINELFGSLSFFTLLTLTVKEIIEIS